MEKIFLSHSSKDAKIAEAFKGYLFNAGIDTDSQLYFTSNNDTGVPLGDDVLNNIHMEMTNAKIVILLLSKNYYNSAYCMNEMGASWILNKPVIPFVLPDIKSKDMLGTISNNKQYALINKEGLNNFHDKYLKDMVKKIRSTNAIEKARDELIGIITKIELNKGDDNNILPNNIIDLRNKDNLFKNESEVPSDENTIDKLINKGFSLNEKLFIKYIVDTDRFKFMTGWQEEHEVEKIKKWEESYNISNNSTTSLSDKYNNIIDKFKMRNFIELSEVTEYDNPKEYKLKHVIFKNILELNSESHKELDSCVNIPF